MAATADSVTSATATQEDEHGQPTSPRAPKRQQSPASETTSKRLRISPDADADADAESLATLRASPPPKAAAAPTAPDRAPDKGRRASRDQEERRRGQRLFGGLLNTLSQRTTDAQQKRRQEVERRQRERAQLQKAEDETRRVERLQKLQEARKREQVNLDEQSMRSRHSNELAMAHFLWTKTQPRLYYKPWELLPGEAERIEVQVSTTEARISREIQEFEQRHKREAPEGQISTEVETSAEKTAGEHQVESTSDAAADIAATNSTNPTTSAEANQPVRADVPPERETADDTGEVVEEGDEDTVIY